MSIWKKFKISWRNFWGHRYRIYENEELIKEINNDNQITNPDGDYDISAICFGKYGNFVKKIIWDEIYYE